MFTWNGRMQRSRCRLIAIQMRCEITQLRSVSHNGHESLPRGGQKHINLLAAYYAVIFYRLWHIMKVACYQNIKQIEIESGKTSGYMLIAKSSWTPPKTAAKWLCIWSRSLPRLWRVCALCLRVFTAVGCSFRCVFHRQPQKHLTCSLTALPIINPLCCLCRESSKSKWPHTVHQISYTIPSDKVA